MLFFSTLNVLLSNFFSLFPFPYLQLVFNFRNNASLEKKTRFFLFIIITQQVSDCYRQTSHLALGGC